MSVSYVMHLLGNCRPNDAPHIQEILTQLHATLLANPEVRMSQQQCLTVVLYAENTQLDQALRATLLLEMRLLYSGPELDYLF